MKKVLKITALLFVVALAAAALCSCQALDEAKEKQAFYTDESKNEIMWKDQLYKQIVTGKYDFVSLYSYENGLYVTQKNIPVLLSSYEGDYATACNDEAVINTYGLYYIREDKYEDVKNTIETAKLDHYYFIDYSYPDYEYDEYYYDRNGYYPEDDNILLDDDITDAINRALKIDDKEKVSYDALEFSEMLIAYPCDKDMLIEDADKAVYIIRDVDKFYIWDGNSYDKNSISPVAEEDTKLFKEFFDDYPNAFEQDDLSYYFYDDDYSYYSYGYGDSSKPVEGV